MKESSDKKQKGLDLIKLDDLFKMDIKEPEWLIDRLLPACGTSLLIAKPKTGKSTLTRNIALAVAKGQPFLGRETKKGKVIYLAMEESLVEVKKHYTELGATEEDEIFIYTNLLPKDAFTRLKESIKEHGASLIIIDTLHRCINVSDGNNYAEMTKALTSFLEISRELNCHVLLVHHTRKGEVNGAESSLGSQALFGLVDTAITMDANCMSIRMIETQQRYGECIPKCALIFDVATRSYSLGDVTATVNPIDRIKEEIISLITDSKSEVLTQEEILDAVTGKKEIVIKVLKDLCETDTPLLIRDGDGVKGKPYTYKLTK